MKILENKEKETEVHVHEEREAPALTPVTIDGSYH